MPIYEIIIEYSYLLLVILLIVKLIQTVMSFRGNNGNNPWDPWGRNNNNHNNGGGNSNSGGNNGGGSNGGGNGPNDVTDDQNGAIPDDSLDSTTGISEKVRIFVHDVNRTGVKSVEIRAYPAQYYKKPIRKLVFKFFTTPLNTPYISETTNDGIATFNNLPAGNVIFELRKLGFAFMNRQLSPFKSKQGWSFHVEHIKPNEENYLEFEMHREGNKAIDFHPYVKAIEFDEVNDKVNLDIEIE